MKRIAVVGAGVAGLASAWLLSRIARVTLFEAAGDLGGHTHTVDVTVEGETFPVDTGFLVFNDRTYPNLCALFDTIGVTSVASEMSFSVRIASENLEWAGSSLSTVFAQRRNLLRPDFWRMLKDIVRFNAEATAAIDRTPPLEGSLGAWLDQRRFGRAFREWYLLPMSAAIWSCPTSEMLEYPVATFLRFCHNHGLLQINDRPQWRTVRGGGREYVRRLAAPLSDVRVGSAVTAVTRDASGVTVDVSGISERFDEVVLAVHGDQALPLLTDADERERQVLGAVRYQPNLALLHTDESLLPRTRETWSAWNYLSGNERDGRRPVSVSYLINRLQPLPCRTPVIVTLNPPVEPDPARVLRRLQYSHPIFDRPAIEAQQALPALQGRRHTWFCGAWTGYGFHEDGLKSALLVANALGAQAPWQTEAMAA